MRILSYKETKDIDINYIYSTHRAIAILNPDTLENFKLVKLTDQEKAELQNKKKFNVLKNVSGKAGDTK